LTKKFRTIAVCIVVSTLTSSAFADLFGVYSNIRTYASGGGGNPDTHEYFGYAAVPFFAGHSEASFDAGSYGASVSASTLVTYGSLHVDQVASSYNSASNGTIAVATHDGNPSAAFFDRLFLNGSNFGAQVTIHVHGWLSGVTRFSGNHWDAWNVPQGLDGAILVANHNPVYVSDYNVSQDSHITGAQYFDVIGTVGSYLDISSTLYADLDTIDTFNSTPQTAFAQTTGTLNSTFTSADSSVTITSASGHDYAEPVPEPASLAVIGLGVLAILRRRKK
jgi:hypothetical protein